MNISGSLHRRVAIGFVLLSLFSATLIFAGKSYLSDKVLQDISLRNLSLAKSISTYSKFAFMCPAQDMEALSHVLSLEHDHIKREQQLKYLYTFGNLFELIQILDETGRVTSVFPPKEEQLGLDLSRQPFFSKAKSSPGLQWTDAFRSAQTESPLVTLSIAFPGGVLAGHLNLRILSEMTKLSDQENNDKIFIIDRKGIVIAHTNPQITLRGVGLLNMESVRKGLAGESGTFYDSYNSEKGLASVAPITETGWAAIVFQPEEEALAAVNSLRTYALSAVLLITAAGLAMIAFAKSTLLKPIETLTKRTEAVSLGEYDVRIIPEYMEFESLALSFNNMAETIGEREKQLYYELQVNRAQAEIVRTITEVNSAEALCAVVHEWALALTMSSHGIVKIVNMSKAEQCVKSEECQPGYLCYFAGQKSFDFPDKINHGELWDKVFHNDSGFMSNDLSDFIKPSSLPEHHINIEKILSVPVIHQSEAMGHIVVANGSRDYTQKDFDTLKIIADLLSVAVNRIRTDRTLINNESKMRKLRNYLSNIINSMPSMLIGVDKDGTITQWNQKASAMTGLSVEEAIGSPLPKAAPHLADELERVKRAIATRQEQSTSKRRRYIDGVSMYEDLTVFPLIANGVEGAVIRVDDVTNRVGLEQMMVQSEKMMSVGGLAAGMAHEINNPLAAILGQNHNLQRRLTEKLPKNVAAAEECGISLDALHDYLEKRDIPRMLASIDDSGNRAATIVSNMLSFSRKSEKRMSTCSLPELMDRTIDLASNDYDLKKEYDFRKVEIIKEYDPQLPEIICEGNEIQQVFLNLLKNGAEAMAEKNYSDGGPRFRIRIYRDKDFAAIQVEDNGPGVDETGRIRMFEPFFTTKKVGKGTGLGLSVSYFIITDQHSGTMEVESAPGEWTRFTIKLPLNNTSDISKQ